MLQSKFYTTVTETNTSRTLLNNKAAFKATQISMQVECCLWNYTAVYYTS